MIKKRYSYLLLASLTLSVLTTPVAVYAEQAEIKDDKVEVSEESKEEVKSSETVLDATSETMETRLVEEDKKSDVVEEESEEENDEMFYYPSNRSDLATSSRAYSAPSTRANTLSITDTNKPRADFVDVSSHNDYISVDEYKIMKSYGIKGVSVKLTEGTSYKNPFAKNQIKNAQAAGLMVSVYHFSWFESEGSAKSEANYFSNMAQELGLSKATLMINDLETPELKYKKGVNHTKNSKAFEKQLNALGYSSVNHYLGLHWINEGVIKPNELGNEKVWVAAYPYNPTSNQYHTQYGAWQWSSSMTFPGVHGVYDISSDYVGSYSSNEKLPPQGNYIDDGRYVKVNKKGYNTWSDFDWTYRKSSEQIYGQRFEARGRYQHTNGSVYYSLYDAQGNWHGYLNSEATIDLPGAQGDYIADNKRYVSIEKKGTSVWQNFSFNKEKNNTSNMYQKTYQVKGHYDHFNGGTFLSLYDGQGNWHGYLDEKATKPATNKNGDYISHNKYVTVEKSGYNTWSNFSWKEKLADKEVYQKTFLAKGRYENVNGSTYLSLFDSEDNWCGYINATATKQGDGVQGAYFADGRYATVVVKDQSLFNDFNWTVRQSTNKIYGQKFAAKGRYHHMNGKTYYSLYDSKNKWQGYAEASLVSLDKNGQGDYIPDGSYVSIQKKNYSMWTNFNFSNEKNNTTTVYEKTYLAKGRYEHFNGNVYYSLYDGNDNWMGYLNKDATKVAPNKNGIYISDGRQVKVTNNGYNTWSNFSWEYREGSETIYNQIFTARGRYENINGLTYLSLYDNAGKWHGYINSNATTVIN